MEKWKDIKGFEGIYKISNQGSIFSIHKNRIMSIKPSLSGYISVGLWKKNKRVVHRVHRIVAEHFIENPSNHPIVDHINGNRSDNSVKNLRWASFSTNSKNVIKGGLHSVGNFIPYTEEELKNEVWVDATKKVKELQGKEFFQVSSLGRVRYYKRNNIWNTVSVQTVSPKTQSRYPRCCIKHNGKRFDFPIHKLVCICFMRYPKKGEVIDHIDSNICNPRLSNLQIISFSENNKKANRVDDSGSNNGMSKHSEEEIHDILKAYYHKKESTSKIISDYKLARQTLDRIVKGQTYKKIYNQFINE